MHAVKQSLRVSGGFSGGLLPVLPVSRQKRPESLSGGADNGCYGKLLWVRQKLPDGVTLRQENEAPEIMLNLGGCT